MNGGVACERPDPTDPGGVARGCFWEALGTAAAIAQCGGSFTGMMAGLASPDPITTVAAGLAAAKVQVWCVGAAAAIGKLVQCFDSGDDVGSPLLQSDRQRLNQKIRGMVGEYNGIAMAFNEAVDEHQIADVDRLKLLEIKDLIGDERK